MELIQNKKMIVRNIYSSKDCKCFFVMWRFFCFFDKFRQIVQFFHDKIIMLILVIFF